MERVPILVKRMLGRKVALRPGLHKKTMVRKFGWEGARAGKLMDLARHRESPVLGGLGQTGGEDSRPQRLAQELYNGNLEALSDYYLQ